SDRGRFNIKDFVPIIKHPLIILASLASFSLMVSNGTLAFALPLNVEVMEKGTETTGILLSTFGIVALIVFMTRVLKIYDVFRAVQLIALGLFLIWVGMVFLVVSAMFGSNFIAMIIYGLGFDFILRSMNIVMADASSKVDRGKAYGGFY